MPEPKSHSFERFEKSLLEKAHRYIQRDAIIKFIRLKEKSSCKLYKSCIQHKGCLLYHSLFTIVPSMTHFFLMLLFVKIVESYRYLD